MKANKMLLMLAGLISCTAAYAAATVGGVPAATVSFGTPGPDYYADGSQIVDGETYYLLFVPTGATFAIDNEGTVTGGATLVHTGKAKDGRCGEVIVELKNVYTNGTFQMVVLDTRDGSGTPTGDIVVSYGAAAPADVPGKETPPATLKAAPVVSGGVVVDTGAVVDPTLPAPKITGFSIGDGKITLKADAPGGVYYSVSVTENLSSGIWTPITEAKRTSAQVLSADSGLALTVDPEKKTQFFKIERVTK